MNAVAKKIKSAPFGMVAFELDGISHHKVLVSYNRLLNRSADQTYIVTYRRDGKVILEARVESLKKVYQFLNVVKGFVY